MSREKEEAKLKEIRLNADESYQLRELLAEAEAIQEMASRVKDFGCNAEDTDMAENASRVTFRLLMQARELVEAAK